MTVASEPAVRWTDVYDLADIMEWQWDRSSESSAYNSDILYLMYI